MLQSSHDVPQAIANNIIGSFNIKKFRNAVINWITESNQALQEIENPAFRTIIGAASKEALTVLWKSRTSVHNHILADFKAFLPAVRIKL